MTTTTCPAASLSNGDDAIAVARALAPEIMRRAGEAEVLGTVPLDLVERLRTAGVFRAAQPRSLGGFEMAPVDFIHMIEELARADGSTGWIAAIGSGAPAFTAWLEPTVATELFGADADFLSATIFAPTGRAVPDGRGRFDIDGRWPFASGCRHAKWILAGIFVFDGDQPRMIPEQGPDQRGAFFPRANTEIVDNWDVLGLRATGSNDLAARGLKVPEEHTISPFFHSARQDGACGGFRSSHSPGSAWSVSHSGSRDAHSTNSPILRRRRCVPRRPSRWQRIPPPRSSSPVPKRF